MKETPINSGRGIYAFLALTPTLLAGNSGAIKIAGSDVNQSHLAIDGTTFDDGQGSYLGPLGNYTEWIQEIQIDVANNSAEFGPLGHVTVVSKSGTNQLHGTVKDYYSTPWFRARNPFALARGTGVFHLYAVNGGGPVYIPKVYDGRNKTFFFASLERSTGGSSTTSFNPTVPIAAWRNGDFSSLLPGVTIYDPLNNQPFAGNQIPSSRINPVSQALQTRFYPLPNFGNTSVLQAQNFRENVTRAWDPTENITVRIDHKLSNKDSIYGRFSYQQGYNRAYEDNLPTIGQRYQLRKDPAASASYTHVFSSSLINEFRWGMAINSNPFWGPVNGSEEVQQLGLQGLAPNLPNIPGMFAVNWSGLGLQPLTQVTYNNPGYRSHLEEFQEHVSWFRGHHNFKLGFDLTLVQFNNLTSDASLYGNATFANRFSSGGITGQGNAYADFLLGIPTTVSRAFPPVETNERRWMYDFFAADEFKVSSKMTLSYGVRYEFHPPWRQKNDLLSMFNPSAGKIVVPDNAFNKVSSLMPVGYVGSRIGQFGGMAAIADLSQQTGFRTADRNRLSALGSQHGFSRRMGNLLQCGAAKSRRRRPSVCDQRACVHQSVDQSANIAAGVSCNQCGGSCNGIDSHGDQPAFAHAIQLPIQRNDRTSAVGHGFPAFLYRDGDSRRLVELQLQFARAQHRPFH